VSSYLTNPTRDWLEKICRDAPFSYHVLEGKQLKKLILGFPELVAQYFLDEYQKLLSEAMSSWLAHSILPESKYRTKVE
jgi:hypothetical protein